MLLFEVVVVEGMFSGLGGFEVVPALLSLPLLVELTPLPSLPLLVELVLLVDSLPLLELLMETVELSQSYAEYEEA